AYWPRGGSGRWPAGRPQDAFDALAPAAGASAAGFAASDAPGESAPPPPESASPPALRLPASPPRKSVTYQPVPFNWKVGAVIIRLNAGLRHCGQSVRGASENFCKTSFSNPQSSQRYA